MRQYDFFGNYYLVEDSIVNSLLHYSERLFLGIIIVNFLNEKEFDSLCTNYEFDRDTLRKIEIRSDPMSNEMIQNEIEKLDELKSLCDETKIKVVGEQNDFNLLSPLDEEYKLTQKVKFEILKLLEGTKKGKSIFKLEENRLKEILFGHCMICGVNYIEKDSNEFVIFDTP